MKSPLRRLWARAALAMLLVAAAATAMQFDAPGRRSYLIYGMTHG